MTDPVTIPQHALRNRGLDIIVAPEMPHEVLSVLLPILTRFTPVIPSWVQRLKLRYDPDDTKYLATLATRTEYRSMTLAVSAAWLTRDQAERAQTIAHELTHAWLAEVGESFAQMLNAGFPDRESAARRLADGQFESACERVAEEMGWLMLDLVPEPTS